MEVDVEWVAEYERFERYTTQGETEMAILAQKGGGDFEICPAGVYTGRCFKVVDIGTQKSEFQGEVKMSRKVIISWELLGGEMMADGRPFSVAKRLTLSLHPKSQMRPLLAAWRGRDFTVEEEAGFDVSKLLGAYCLLNVIHETGKNGTVYSNIGSIMPLPKGTVKPDGVNPIVLFEIDNPDMKIYEAMSDKMKTLIRDTPEWQKRVGGSGFRDMENDMPYGEGQDDSTPF